MRTLSKSQKDFIKEQQRLMLISVQFGGNGQAEMDKIRECAAAVAVESKVYFNCHSMNNNGGNILALSLSECEKFYWTSGTGRSETMTHVDDMPLNDFLSSFKKLISLGDL